MSEGIPSGTLSTPVESSTSSTSNSNGTRIYSKSVTKDTERVISEVSIPNWDAIPTDELFDSNGNPRPEKLREHFSKEGRLLEKDAIAIINKAAAIFKKEPNILHVQDPITVCGDIHGQYYDLLKLFEIGGDPMEGQYLFLGDYVDRGYFSTEATIYLLAYKILKPDGFFMLRGNHECRHLTSYFNFKQECKFKYSLAVYDAFMSCFDCLPLAAILNGRFFCVHGGLSPDVKTIEDINNINRFREPPPNGAMCDLIWSDPMDEEEEEAKPDSLYLHNELRGCSYVYSYNAVCNFLKTNNLLSVIRAHEAQDEGYRLYKKNAANGFPTVICIFSAPNYCDVYNNKGAIIRFQNNLMNIRQFNCSPHPYYLPNFMNAFNWSLPFVAEKVTDMLLTILNLSDDTDDSDEEEQAPVIDKERGEVIKAKIRTVGKLSRMYKTLREEHESIIILKGLAGGTIPQGLLSQGPDAVKTAIGDFKKAKEMDSINEKRPPMMDLQQ